MKKLKVVSVSYLNSLPFNYTLKEWEKCGEIELTLEPPNRCADIVLSGKADLGLVPIGALHKNNEYSIISDFCIGCKGEVKSVGLFYKGNFENIQKVLLDSESRTSVLLTKLIFEHFHKKSVIYDFVDLNINTSLTENTAILAIGDKAIALHEKAEYEFLDYGKEWHKLTGLPFVFACWATVCNPKRLPVGKLNEYLQKGIASKNNILNSWLSENKNRVYRNFNYKKYFDKQINFFLKEEEKKAIELFFRLLSEP